MRHSVITSHETIIMLNNSFKTVSIPVFFGNVALPTVADSTDIYQIKQSD